MGFGVGELDGPDAAKVVKVASDLVVGGTDGELVVGDEQIGLGDVCGGEIVAEEEYEGSCLRLLIFAEDRAPDTL